MRIGKFEITASRWPWQRGYNWKGSKNLAPLNPNGARFGGGWKYELGVSIGESGTVSFSLIFGIITIRKAMKHERP